MTKALTKKPCFVIVLGFNKFAYKTLPNDGAAEKLNSRKVSVKFSKGTLQIVV